MLVPVSPELSRTRCPGCNYEEERKMRENEKVKWSVVTQIIAHHVCLWSFSTACPMTYRWSQRSAALVDPLILETAQLGREPEDQDISSFCRVDIIEPPGRRSQRNLWYCSECGDGPYGVWQSGCQACNHARCESCATE